MRSKLVVILTLALFLGCCAGFLAPDRGNDAVPDQIVLRTALLDLEPARASAGAVVLPGAGAVPPAGPLLAARPASFRC